MVEVGEIFFVKITGMAMRKNEKVQNCLGIEEGSVSGDYKDDFANK